MSLKVRETRPCKACGMKITGIIGPNGNVIPAQRIKTLYRLDREGNALTLRKIDTIAGDKLEGYVSHFETCPNAADFSRTRKE
jgi:hypothetical protein